MYKSLEEIDPNEIVTKSHLKAEFLEFEKRIDEKFDVKFKEQSEEFQRYVGMLSEEFQSRLSTVIEIVLSDREKLLSHDEQIAKLLLKHV